MNVDQIADSLVHQRPANWRIHADATKAWFRLVFSNDGDGPSVGLRQKGSDAIELRD